MVKPKGRKMKLTNERRSYGIPLLTSANRSVLKKFRCCSSCSRSINAERRMISGPQAMYLLSTVDAATAAAARNTTHGRFKSVFSYYERDDTYFETSFHEACYVWYSRNESYTRTYRLRRTCTGARHVATTIRILVRVYVWVVARFDAARDDLYAIFFVSYYDFCISPLAATTAREPWSVQEAVSMTAIQDTSARHL